jgi:hypothetical protein
MDSIPTGLFDILGNTDVKKTLLASIQNVIPTLTQEDIDKRVKPRYFAKYTAQRNGLIYELDGGQYAAIEDNNLFRKTTIDWIIRGKLEDTILTLPSGDNILIKGVISQNKELLSLAEEKLPGITNHLRNYMEFWSGE